MPRIRHLLLLLAAALSALHLCRPFFVRRPLRPGAPDPAPPSSAVPIGLAIVQAGPLPPYFEVFAESTRGVEGMLDVLIFHTRRTPIAPRLARDFPALHFIDIGSLADLASRMVRVLYHDCSPAVQEATAIHLARYFDNNPYNLHNFKPVLGALFADRLQGYSHWAYGDYDVIYGDLRRWISEEELRSFDIITLTMGDTDRVYLRGQLTIFQNGPRTSGLWRLCGKLRDLPGRNPSEIRQFIDEGCFSRAVADHKELRVLYTPRQIADWNSFEAFWEESSESGRRAVFYEITNGGRLRWVRQQQQQPAPMVLEPKLRPDETTARRVLPFGDTKTRPCPVHWVYRGYRRCVEPPARADASFDVVQSGGEFTVREFEALYPGHDAVREGAFFHFQNLKKKNSWTHAANFNLTGFGTGGVAITRAGIFPTYPTPTTSAQDDVS